MKRYLLLLSALSCGYAYAAYDYQINTTSPIDYNWNDIVWTSETETTQNRDRYYFDINNTESSAIRIQNGETIVLDSAAMYVRQYTNLLIGGDDDTKTSTLHITDTGKDTFIEQCNRSQIVVNKNGVLQLDGNKGIRFWTPQSTASDPDKVHILVDGGTVIAGGFGSNGGGSEQGKVLFRNGATLQRNIEANPLNFQNNTSFVFDNSTYNVWNKDASQNNGFGNHVINTAANNQNMHIDVVFDNGSVVNGLGVVNEGKTAVEYYNFVDPIPTSGLSGADLTLQIGTMTAADIYFNFSLLNGSKLSAKGVRLGNENGASAVGTYTFKMQGDSAERTAILANSGGTTVDISNYDGSDSAYTLNFLMNGNAVYNSRGNFVVGNAYGSNTRFSFRSGTANFSITGENNTFNAGRLYMLNNADRNEIESCANASFFFGVNDGSASAAATNSAMNVGGISVYNGYDTNAKVVIGGATNTFTTTANFEFYGFRYESEGSSKATIELTDNIAVTTSSGLAMYNYASGKNEFIVSNGANVSIGGVALRAYNETAWDYENPYTAVSSIIIDGATFTTSNNWDFGTGASGLTQVILKGDGATLTSNAQMNLNYAGTDSRKFLVSMEGTNGTLDAKLNFNFHGKMTEDESGGIGGYYLSMTGSGNTLSVGGGLNFNNSESTGGTYQIYSKSDSAEAKNYIIVNQNEFNLQGYYKSDLDPDEDEQSTTKTQLILAGNTELKRANDSRYTIKLGEFSGRQFWGGDLLLEVNGSGNKLYIDGLYVGNGARLAGEDRVRIVGGGSVIDVNSFRMMRGNAEVGTSWANPVGGVLEYQIDSKGISTIVINNGINNALNGALIIDFSALADVQCINEKYVLMSSSPNIKNNLEQYWIDFANNTVKDTDLVNVISSGAADEDIRFAYEQNTETNYYDFVIYYTANVPEPATCAAVFGALALAFAAYRRRK
ncbi:MAG: hypothetical protein J6P03_01805 [Opitutales bacterium]|nr:hypothetical protein [Opitutales bacterium]